MVRISQDGKRKNIISDTLKTDSSYRILPLDEKLIALFVEIKKQQEYNGQICGGSYCTEYLDYVCVNATGKRHESNTSALGTE